MVAVLTVVANHLWGWPGGGFIGVDEAAGNVSFRHFYWNRVRRIVPAATVVLLRPGFQRPCTISRTVCHTSEQPVPTLGLFDREPPS